MLDLNTRHISSCQKFLIKICLFFFCSFPLLGNNWAEKKLSELSIDEKIAQLFMISVHTNDAHNNVDSTLQLLKEIPVGGIIFTTDSLSKQKEATRLFQVQSRTPLLIGQDCEWGLNMRLKEALRFPRNLTLGALSNSKSIYSLGQEIGRQCKAIGLHVNFAPVIDINNNPLNPVINDRSFGENPSKVTEYALHFMKGLEKEGVMACAKHFPGHGDTHIDSHLALPVIEKSIQDLEALEWKPFRALIKENLSAVMVAHLNLPLIAGDLPSSLSREIIQKCLKKKLGFKGLIFTDSTIMKAISESYDAGHSDLLALMAGNDVILEPRDIRQSIKRIKKGLLTGEISESEINEKVLKILKAKEKYVLGKDVSSQFDLFSQKAKNLKKQLFFDALTLVKREKNSLPIQSKKRIAFVQIGRDLIMKLSLKMSEEPLELQFPKKMTPFYDTLQKKQPVDFFFLPKNATKDEVKALTSSLKEYAQVIVGVYEMNKFSHLNFGVCTSTLDFLKNLKKEEKKVFLTLFGSPYSLKYFSDEAVILMAYENDEDAQIGAAKVLLGEVKAKGHLPVTASSNYPEGLGL